MSFLADLNQKASSQNMFYSRRLIGWAVFVVIFWIFCGESNFQNLIVRAETRVGGSLGVDTVWSPAGNPYLLTSNVFVPAGRTLVVEAGVNIRLAPEVIPLTDSPGIYVNDGYLVIKGSREARVTIDRLPGVFVHSGILGRSRADIMRADFLNGSTLSFQNATGTVATSTFVGGPRGVSADHSRVSIWGSRLINHYFTGLYVAAGSAEPVSVEGSDLSGNMMYALYNIGSTKVLARNNWWGSEAGPLLPRPQLQEGAADFEPWLSGRPDFDPPEAESSPGEIKCCSSILFLPGIEGTRLYRSGDRLWEPLSSADLSVLHLSANGLPLYPDIYAGEPIGKFLGLFGVYDKFSHFLDGFVQEGLIREWRAFGYDWRQAVTDVVSLANKRATSTELLLTVMRNLAAHSNSGRVTIIAHSNGGLVAEALGRLLAEQGLADLVDKVINVGVPMLGTPAALAALLHGYGQSIAGGWIVREADARSLSGNMPSVYGLLPSEEFFRRTNFGPIVTFAASSPVAAWLGSSVPPPITEATVLRQFITNTAHSRQAPWSFDTTKPIIGNDLLLPAAVVLHEWSDHFLFSASTTVWSIVGWHRPTPLGIAYTPYGYRVNQTLSGDGVVVAPSAAASGQVFSVDLAKLSEEEGYSFTHANFLESVGVQSLIRRLVASLGHESPAALAGDQVSIYPSALDWSVIHENGVLARRELRIATHSPVVVDVYDDSGNHVGLLNSPGDFLTYEEKIPGSLFERLGCLDEEALDCQYAVTVPDDGRAYTVVVTGTKRGVFTLTIERWRGSTMTEEIEWRGWPIFGAMAATTTIKSLSNSSGGFDNATLSQSTSPLGFDFDQDGQADTYAPATTTATTTIPATTPDTTTATTTDPWLAACQIAFPR